MDAGCCVVQDKTQHSRLKNKIIDLFLLNFSRFIFVYFGLWLTVWVYYRLLMAGFLNQKA
jgi:hypothetical protein